VILKAILFVFSEFLLLAVMLVIESIIVLRLSWI